MRTHRHCQSQSQSQSQSSLSVSVYVLLHIRTALFQAALLTAPFNLTVYWNVLNGNGNGWHAGLSEVELRRGSLCLCHLLLLSTYLLEAPGRLD